MKKELLESIIKDVRTIQSNIKDRMPIFDAYVDHVIKDNIESAKDIEPVLATLETCAEMNIGKDIYIKLYSYYESIHPKNASYYKNYDKDKNLRLLYD